MDVMQCKHISDRIVPVDPLCSNCNTYEVRRVHAMSYGVCIWSTVYSDSREPWHGPSSIIISTWGRYCIETSQASA